MKITNPAPHGTATFGRKTYVLSQAPYLTDDGRKWTAMATNGHRIYWTNLEYNHRYDNDTQMCSCGNDPCRYEDAENCANWDCVESIA